MEMFRRSVLCVWIALLFTIVHGFRIPRPTQSLRAIRALKLSDNYIDSLGDTPSDTSDVDLQSRVISETSVNEKGPKQILFDTSESTLRADIIEAVLKLEKVNPTPEPAYSPLLNGVWSFASFTGFGSLGLLGYQALKLLPNVQTSDIQLTISSVAPRAKGTGTVRLGTLYLDFSVVSDIEAVSGTRLREQYISAQVANLPELPLSSVSQLSREVVISYLDEDLLIVRDSFGSPEILKRKDYPGGSAMASEGEAS